MYIRDMNMYTRMNSAKYKIIKIVIDNFPSETPLPQGSIMKKRKKHG